MIIENVIDTDGDGFEYEVKILDVCFAYTKINEKSNNIMLYTFEPQNIRKTMQRK